MIKSFMSCRTAVTKWHPCFLEYADWNWGLDSSVLRYFEAITSWLKIPFPHLMLRFVKVTSYVGYPRNR